MVCQSGHQYHIVIIIIALYKSCYLESKLSLLFSVKSLYLWLLRARINCRISLSSSKNKHDEVWLKITTESFHYPVSSLWTWHSPPFTLIFFNIIQKHCFFPKVFYISGTFIVVILNSWFEFSWITLVNLGRDPPGPMLFPYSSHTKEVHPYSLLGVVADGTFTLGTVFRVPAKHVYCRVRWASPVGFPPLAGAQEFTFLFPSLFNIIKTQLHFQSGLSNILRAKVILNSVCLSGFLLAFILVIPSVIMVLERFYEL